MSQPRVDSYTAVHKALRHVMYETGRLLERTNFADATAKAEALASAERTLGFLDEHLSLEDRFLAPAVKQAASADLQSELEEQHREHEQLSEEMTELFDELRAAKGAEAVGLGFELCKLFNLMVAEQSYHMNQEERDANTALWEAFSDEELLELGGKLRATIAPPRLVEWMTIMLPNLNHQELVGMLSGMKATAPEAAFARVAELSERVLGERWPAVRAAVFQS